MRANGDDIIAWARTLDIIKHLNSETIIVGVAATPERVRELAREQKNFAVKALFIGYGNESYVDVMLEHAEQHKETDYLFHEEVKRKNAGEPSHRDSMPGQVEMSEKLKQRAEKYGYGYYGAVRQPTLEKHVQIILDILAKC